MRITEQNPERPPTRPRPPAPAEAEPQPARRGPRAVRRPSPPRRPGTRLLVSAVVAALIAFAGAATLALAGRERGEDPAADRALLDPDATTKVIGDVSNALTKVFSYTPDGTAETERVAAQVLAGKAAADFRRLFAQVKQQAPAQRAAQTTRVVRAGVISLSDDTAHLLIFLDQVTTRAGRPQSTAAAQLSVTAELHDGRWRITDLKSN